MHKWAETRYEYYLQHLKKWLNRPPTLRFNKSDNTVSNTLKPKTYPQTRQTCTDKVMVGPDFY